MNRIDRYEAKYTVPVSMVEGICDFISPYCYFDKHSEGTPDHLYTVNSLYLDSPRHLFLRQRIDKAERRFNMRIRSYGDDPKPPFFLEVKHRTGDLIRKFRGTVPDGRVEEAICRPWNLDEAGEDPERENTALFRRLAHAYGARPQVLIQYRRKAYFSHCDDYARVTFDTALRYMPRDDFLPVPEPGGMRGCDLETFFDEGASVILELKCLASAVPLWMLDLVRAFGLRRRGFSKYSTGMAQIFRELAREGDTRFSPWAAR